jgi:hypothetical protein
MVAGPMPAYSAVLPPSSLGEALRPLRDFSDTEFRSLMAAVSGLRSFSLSKDQVTSLRKELPRHAANLPFLLGALSYLYSYISQLVESGVAYYEAISVAIDELDEAAEWGPNKKQVREKLAAILENKEVHQRFRKIQRLQSGFIPNAVGFSTFVDLRPDFGEGEDVAVKGYLTIIQFRVSTDSSSPEGRRLVFQMSEDALEELKKAIARAEAKLAALKKEPTIALQLIKVSNV